MERKKTHQSYGLAFAFASMLCCAAAFADGQVAVQSAHVGVNSGGWSLNNTTVGFKNGRVAAPFVMRGTRIDALRLYHIYSNTSYAGGNGGTVKYEIYADIEGKPGGPVLAETDVIIAATTIDTKKKVGWDSKFVALATYPKALWSPSGETSATALTKFRKIPFKEPAFLEDGGHYWYVVTNTSPEPEADFISINNLITNEAVYANDPWYTHPASTIYVDRENTGEWTDKKDIPIFEFYGEKTFGRVWMEEPSVNDNKGYQLTDGQDLAREIFTLEQSDSFTAVSLFAGRDSGSGSVYFKVRDSKDGVIESGEFADFPTLSDDKNGDQRRREMQWRTATFANPITLYEGQQYSIEFFASSDHSIGSFRDGAKSGYFEGSSNALSGFLEGTMQISTNNGKDWVEPTQWDKPQKYMDIETYLTRVSRVQ